MFLLRTTIQKLFTNTINQQQAKIQLNSTQIRTKVIYYLPNPTETKRVRKQGFAKKVKTVNGRKELMFKILRGDKVISQ